MLYLPLPFWHKQSWFTRTMQTRPVAETDFEDTIQLALTNSFVGEEQNRPDLAAEILIRIKVGVCAILDNDDIPYIVSVIFGDNNVTENDRDEVEDEFVGIIKKAVSAILAEAGIRASPSRIRILSKGILDGFINYVDGLDADGAVDHVASIITGIVSGISGDMASAPLMASAPPMTPLMMPLMMPLMASAPPMTPRSTNM
jgi:hypothetical protein